MKFHKNKTIIDLNILKKRRVQYDIITLFIIELNEKLIDY